MSFIRDLIDKILNTNEDDPILDARIEFRLNNKEKILIKKYCDLLNINIKNTIAFGDQYNDLEMLKIVGCGIAMKNAPLGIKKEVKQNSLRYFLNILSKLFPFASSSISLSR